LTIFTLKSDQLDFTKVQTANCKQFGGGKSNPNDEKGRNYYQKRNITTKQQQNEILAHFVIIFC